MRDTESLEGLQQKRRSLEDKAKTLEEKARMDKLAIDKRLAVLILEEENRTHEDAVKELENKIANLEQQMKPSTSEESTPVQTPHEPAQEISEDADEGVSVGMVQEPEQSDVEVLQEGTTRKKRRSLF